MPLYIYRCAMCHEQFQRIQKFTEKPTNRCPRCRSRMVRRVIQSPAIAFKGTGFYRNDSRPPKNEEST